MRVSLIGHGTRGDVQPMVLLADALASRGHAVRVVAPTDATSMLARAGLEHAAIPVDVTAALAAPEGRAMLARGDMDAFFAWFVALERPATRAISDAIARGCEGADVIVASALAVDRAGAVADARGVPLIPLSVYPTEPSRAFPSPFLATWDMGPQNRLTHTLLLNTAWREMRPEVARLRVERGAPEAHGPRLSTHTGTSVFAYSAHVGDRPSDWRDTTHVVGAFRFPPGLRARLGQDIVPEGLDAWIAAGPAPIYFGTGSMTLGDPSRVLAMLDELLAARAARAVVSIDPALARRTERIFTVASIDHDWLLPRCSLAVHHGGSGTLHATLEAALPTVVCSVFGEQPYWGACAERLGVGTTLPFRTLDARTLDTAIARVDTARVRAAADQLAAKLHAEDGLTRAVEIVEGVAP